MNSTQVSDEVPADRLADSLVTIARSRPEGTSIEAWTTLALALADEVGRGGRRYKSEVVLPASASDVAWKRENSVPGILSFTVNYDRSGGQISGRKRTEIKIDELVVSAKGQLVEAGIDLDDAAEAVADALRDSEDDCLDVVADWISGNASGYAGADADGRVDARWTADGRPGTGGGRRDGDGGDGSAHRSGDGRPTSGFGNCTDHPHPNRPSADSDLRSEVDICFVNPPTTARCNRQQWEALVGRTSSAQQQWVALDLIEKARSAHYTTGEDEEEDSWAVMSNGKLNDDFKVSYPTSSVYKNCEIIECDGSYISPQQAEELGVDPEAREMRISEDFLRLWTRLAEEGGMRRYKAHRRKLVRTTKPQPMTTDLYDENRNDIPDLVKDALKVLQEADHEIIIEAIEEAEEAIAEEDGAEAQHRLTSLRLAKETIKRQVIQSQDGVAHLQNAYKIQSISGRVSFKRGGPQGLMGEVKAKAYDIDGYRNFDIKSCHTAALKQVASMLEELGVEIDVSPWTEYVGKDKVVEQTGLPRSLVKVVEHAVKYGAVLPASMKQVREFYVDDGEDEDDPANWPSIAREVHEHAQKGLLDDPDKALSTLRDVFGEMRRVVVEMAQALLTDYYDAHAKGGWMKNACGVSFGKHNYEEGHEQRSKVMAWMLQGLEAAFCHHLTVLSAESDAFSVVANEHDGLIIRKETEDEQRFQNAISEAVEDARNRSGFHRAKLVEKPFADEEDIEELYGAESGAEADESGAEEGYSQVVEDWMERRQRKKRERDPHEPPEGVKEYMETRDHPEPVQLDEDDPILKQHLRKHEPPQQQEEEEMYFSAPQPPGL